MGGGRGESGERFGEWERRGVEEEGRGGEERGGRSMLSQSGIIQCCALEGLKLLIWIEQRCAECVG